MRGKRATTEQIIAVLKEAEAGAKPMEPCRKYGISDQTLDNWKAKYGGRTVSEARRLKDLEQTPNRALHLTGPALRFFATPRSLQPARQVNAVVRRREARRWQWLSRIPGTLCKPT
jgi:putative transposase